MSKTRWILYIPIDLVAALLDVFDHASWGSLFSDAYIVSTYLLNKTGD